MGYVDWDYMTIDMFFMPTSAKRSTVTVVGTDVLGTTRKQF